jgi:integrase
MTATLIERNHKYYVVLNWVQDGERNRKWINTDLPVGGNKRRAEALRLELLQAWQDRLSENPTDVLFSDYIKQWLEERRSALADTTYWEYRNTVRRYIAPYFASLKVKLLDLKPHHIQTFYNAKIAEGVSANTVHHYHANIHRALKDAARLELIPNNPADKVVLPKKAVFRGGFYSQDELRKLITIVAGTKLEVPVMLASWFGMRRGEIVGVRWDAVDLAEKVLYMNGTITDKGEHSRMKNLQYRNFGKTATSIRAFPLEDGHIEYFEELRRRQSSNKSLAGSSYNAEWSDFVCVDVIGNLILPEYISRVFPQVIAKNGLRKIRFHDLRHTNATLLLEAGASLKEVQDWMGHKSVLTTGNIYGHVQLHAKRKLSSAMCGIMASG